MKSKTLYDGGNFVEYIDMNEELPSLLSAVATSLRLGTGCVNVQNHPEHPKLQILTITGVYDTALAWSLVEYINTEMRNFLPRESTSENVLETFIYRSREMVAICVPVSSDLGVKGLCQAILERNDDLAFCLQYPKVGRHIEQFGFAGAREKVLGLAAQPSALAVG